MRTDLNRWGSDGSFRGCASADLTDHWLDDALRNVPLPEGFLARLGQLSESPPARDEDRDHSGRFAPTRGLSGTVRRGGASKRGFRS